MTNYTVARQGGTKSQRSTKEWGIQEMLREFNSPGFLSCHVGNLASIRYGVSGYVSTLGYATFVYLPKKKKTIFIFLFVIFFLLFRQHWSICVKVPSASPSSLSLLPLCLHELNNNV